MPKDSLPPPGLATTITQHSPGAFLELGLFEDTDGASRVYWYLAGHDDSAVSAAAFSIYPTGLSYTARPAFVLGPRPGTIFFTPP